MATPQETSHPSAGQEFRERLLVGLPVRERRLHLAGIPTTCLEGGDGPPIVLLHGPGEHAVKWMRVLPELTENYRVVAPDLPGHGASGTGGEPLGADRVLAWLAELIERCCSTPPTLVGQILGGAIAARFAARYRHRIRRLVLVDSLGLAPFQPAPEFGRALQGFLGEPNERTHEALWRRCAFDLDRLRDRLEERWDAFAAYNLARARSSGVQAAIHALMSEFGMDPIAPEELERIAVPTTLVWGREDLATPLAVAEAASARHGWPLRVIDDCGDDPPFERPEAFVKVLRSTLEEQPGGAGEKSGGAETVGSRGDRLDSSIA